MRCYIIKIWLVLALAFSGFMGNMSLSLANDDAFTIIICTPSGFQQITIDENGKAVKQDISTEDLSYQQDDCQLCTAHTPFIDTSFVTSDYVLHTHKVRYIQKHVCSSRIRPQNHRSVRAPPSL